MGLRVNMIEARAALADALAAMEVFPLGPTPNSFGSPTSTKAQAEQARDDYNDRSTIGVHTTDGWTVFVGGTGRSLLLASKATYPSAPWGTGPVWLWPDDVKITYKGSRITYMGHGGLTYSPSWKHIRVLLSTHRIITTTFGDPIDVVIPGATWASGYASGEAFIKLIHQDGEEWQYWDGKAWVTKVPKKLIDADILEDRPSAMPSRNWVRVGEMSSTIEPRVFTGRPVGYSADIDIELEIGSGPAHTSPEEADFLAYDTMDKVLDVIGTIPALPNTGRLTPTGHVTMEGWAESERHETILGLSVRVVSR